MSSPNLQLTHTQAASSSRDWIQGATTITRNNVLIEQQMGLNPDPLLGEMMLSPEHTERCFSHSLSTTGSPLYSKPSVDKLKMFCQVCSWETIQVLQSIAPQKHTQLLDPHIPPLGVGLSVSATVIISNANTNNFSNCAPCVPSPAVS